MTYKHRYKWEWFKKHIFVTYIGHLLDKYNKRKHGKQLINEQRQYQSLQRAVLLCSSRACEGWIPPPLALPPSFTRDRSALTMGQQNICQTIEQPHAVINMAIHSHGHAADFSGLVNYNTLFTRTYDTRYFGELIRTKDRFEIRSIIWATKGWGEKWLISILRAEVYTKCQVQFKSIELWRW